MQRVLTALVLFLSLTTHAADWPNYRGPNHDGISTETGWKTTWPAEGPKRLWKATVGTGFSSVSVSEGRVCTMGNSNNQDTIWCFDAETGKELWHHSYPCPTDPNLFEGGPTATPAMVDTRVLTQSLVYTLSRRGDVFCIEAASGKIAWTTNVAKALGLKIPTWGFAGSPLFIDTRSTGGPMNLYLNVGTAGVALDGFNGKIVWSSGAKASGYTTPVPCSFAGQQAIALCIASDVVALEIKSGKPLWQYPWKTDYDINAADPVIEADNVFVSSGYEHGAALLQIHDDQPPSLVWQNKNMRNQISSSVLFEGHLYGMDGNNGHDITLKCVEFKTGKILWNHQGFGTGTLMMADKKLIILGDKGELAVAEASPEAFKLIAHAQILGGKCWTVPVLANGRIYCRNAKGDLVCLDVK